MAKKAYRCPGCGTEVVLDEGDMVPECCGTKMMEIPLEEGAQARGAENTGSAGGSGGNGTG